VTKLNKENKTASNNSDVGDERQSFRERFRWAIETLKDLHGLITAVATVLLFLATLALYCATANLVHDADKNAQKQLRAYVNAERPKVEGLDPVDLKDVTELTIGFSLVNTGQTPAKELRAELAIALREYPLPKGDFTAEAVVLDAVMLGKDIPVGGVKSKGFTRSEIGVMREARSQRLYVLGRACYRDVFDKSHTLGFCFMYMGDRLKAFALCEGNWNYDKQERCPQPPQQGGTRIITPATSGTGMILTPVTSTGLITNPMIVTPPASPSTLTLPNRPIETPK
jgi:hypothetical protein